MRVRVAVLVDTDGNWVANGYKNQVEDEVERDLDYCVGEKHVVHWMEAEFPVPLAETTPTYPTPCPVLRRGHH